MSRRYWMYVGMQGLFTIAGLFMCVSGWVSGNEVDGAFGVACFAFAANFDLRADLAASSQNEPGC